jgi:large subunit ribosomal protein L14e
MIEVGRICIKRKGREKGKYCIVVKEIDKNFVLITGPKKLTGIKRRRCNILHLEPTQYFLEIKEEMNDEEILKLFEKENLIKKLELKKL